MKYLTAILLLAMNTAQAAPVTISWSHPTAREDGTSLDISEIAGTNVKITIDGIGIWGPFLIPPEYTETIVETSNFSCYKFSTPLHDGTESAYLDWLCLSNTPKGEGQ